MKDRIAIVNGIRSPFCKAGGVLRDIEADDLGAFIVRELMARVNIPTEEIDEVIFGNVLQPPHAMNVARVIAVKAGLPVSIPAYTVNRNCASGLEAITSAATKISQDEAAVIIAGGVESMSHFPVLFSNEMRTFLTGLNKAKTWQQKLAVLATFRLKFLKPQIPEIADPLCGLSMGQTAEVLSRDFKVTREEQDEYSLLSQERAVNAIKEGRFAEEIAPIPLPPKYQKYQTIDDGPRENQTLAALAKLPPVFDKVTGTVTAGNSSQVTDGAAAVLLMRESQAKALGLEPLAYIRGYATAGLDPRRMGLGPIYATSLLLAKTGLTMKDFDLIEINEAFSAQIVALERAFVSAEFAKNQLGRDEALGELGRERLNVNGGAVAIGHPLGASGTRLVIALAKELRRRKKNRGLATLCIGGGQGEAICIEIN